MDIIISSDTIMVAAEGQVSCDLSGEAAILNLKNGVYYGLNPIGAKIWNMLQKPAKINKLRDAILDEYEVEPKQCEQDLLFILQQLITEGLVEIKDELAL
jgi:hypothetical protein